MVFDNLFLHSIIESKSALCSPVNTKTATTQFYRNGNEERTLMESFKVGIFEGLTNFSFEDFLCRMMVLQPSP